MTLQARKIDKKLGLLNQVLSRARAVDSEEQLVLRIHAGYGDGDNFVVPLSEVGGALQKSYAVACYCAQGRAIRNQRVVLWDTMKRGDQLHEHLTLRHFIMAAQRVEDPAMLSIAAPKQKEAFLRGDRGQKRDHGGRFR